MRLKGDRGAKDLNIIDDGFGRTHHIKVVQFHMSTC